MSFFLVRAFFLIVAIVVTLLLGVGVAYRKPRTIVGGVFASLCFTIALYDFFTLLAVYSDQIAPAVFWVKACQWGVFLLACDLLIFSVVFRFSENLSKIWGHLIPVFLVIIPAFILLNPNLVETVELGLYNPIATYNHEPQLAFLLVLAFCAILSLYHFFRTWLTSRGIKRARVEYIIGGITAYFIGGTAIGFVLPLLGYDKAHGFSGAMGVLLVAPIGYSIVRFRLLDMGWLARRLLLLFATSIYFAIGITLVLAGGEWLLHSSVSLTSPQYVLVALASLIFSVTLFSPLKPKFQARFNQFISSEAYKLDSILESLSTTLRTVDDLETIVSQALFRVCDQIGISYSRAYIKKEKDKDLTLIAQYGAQEEPLSNFLAEDSILVQCIHKRKESLMVEELQGWNNQDKSLIVGQEMEEVQAKLAVPIHFKNELLGVLCFGPKLSEFIFSSEEISFLESLSGQLALTIQNFSLYFQVEEERIFQKTILDNLPTGVVTVDLEKRITALNREGERTLGLTFDYLQGEKVDKISPVFSFLVNEIWQKGNYAQQEEIHLNLLDGRTIPLSITATSFKSRKGEIDGALIIFNDLSEFKELENQARRNERLASIGTLAAGIAHEIKNPLVSIKTFAQLLPEKYEDQEFRNSFFRLASGEIDRINTLVEHLLNLAKPREIQFQPVHVSSLAKEVLDLLGGEFHKKRIKIDFFFSEAEPMVSGDHKQIKQVLLNLLKNAIDSVSEEFGFISVSVFSGKNPPPGFEEKENSGIFLEIRDNGKGIPPSQLQSIFDPFFSTKESGTGLGLSISHKIITDHGGEIWVRSKPGETVFLICLPYSYEATMEVQV